MKPKIYPVKFFKKKRLPVHELNVTECENCGHEFRGHFCPDCGQEVAAFDRPFGFVFNDFADNFFGFDTRFLQTFRYLLFRPGLLTTEFFRGKRVRYSPPFRIFVFLSFILFLLLQALTERTLDFTHDPKSSESLQVAELNLNMGSKAAEIHADTAGANIDFAKLFSSGKLRDNLADLADNLEIKRDTTTNPGKRDQLASMISMCRTPDIVISNIMKYMSWAFFIMLPLFALVLKLFYIRRKQLYIRHLIFSVHLHSFLFFILSIVATLMLVFHSGVDTIILLLLWTFPLYFVVALKRFYGQSWFKVIFKFLFISFIYNGMLLSLVVMVFLKSFEVI